MVLVQLDGHERAAHFQGLGRGRIRRRRRPEYDPPFPLTFLSGVRLLSARALSARFSPKRVMVSSLTVSCRCVAVLERMGRGGDGRTKAVLHTGFADSEAADDAPPRESLEIRCLLFWPPPEDAEDKARL